jgi:DNA polymerase I
MTATVVALQPYRELLEIKNLLREASALGARFRISGFRVEVDRGAALPEPLRQSLRHHAESGLLCAYLGGEEQDLPALELSDQIGAESVLVETRCGLRTAVRALLTDIRQHGDMIGLDIETAPRPGQADRPWIRLNSDGSLAAVQPVTQDRTGLDPHCSNIQTVQLYAGGARCYVLRGEALLMLLPSHWLRRQHLVIHNAGFELKFFMQHCADYRPPPHRRVHFRYECTAQATGLLTGVGFGGSGRSLAAAAKAFLALDVPKELQTSDWGAVHLSPGQLAYAASDAIIARRLWPILQQQLRRKRRWPAYELQRKAIPAVSDMELRGLGFDRDEHKRQVDIWAQELAAARQQYHDITGQPPPAKPAEVREWLNWVLDPARRARWPRTDSGTELSIAAIHLKRLGDVKSARPVLALLAKEKLLSTFGASFAAKVNPITGRLHTSYNLAASKAGRFSASGPNLQQLPSTKAPEFKRCISASPGFVIVGCDWSQIELRGAAWRSGDRTMTRVYAEGRDLHTETAAYIAGIPVAAVTPEQRQAAKPVNFGAIYGIGPDSLAANAFADYGVDMSSKQAADALARFFNIYHGLARWRDEHARLCQRRGYVEIGCGRVVEARWEPGGKLSFPQCCNLPIQGICADAMLRAITMVHARLRQAGLPGGLIASVHDELLLEVTEDDAEAARTLLEAAMIEAFAVTFPGAPTLGVAEAKIGRTWAEVK